MTRKPAPARKLLAIAFAAVTGTVTASAAADIPPPPKNAWIRPVQCRVYAPLPASNMRIRVYNSLKHTVKWPWWVRWRLSNGTAGWHYVTAAYSVPRRPGTVLLQKSFPGRKCADRKCANLGLTCSARIYLRPAKVTPNTKVPGSGGRLRTAPRRTHSVYRSRQRTAPRQR